MESCDDDPKSHQAYSISTHPKILRIMINVKVFIIIKDTDIDMQFVDNSKFINTNNLSNSITVTIVYMVFTCKCR